MKMSCCKNVHEDILYIVLIESSPAVCENKLPQKYP